MSFPTPWPRIVVTGVLLAAVVAVVVLAFSWPNITSQAKNFPVAVSGSPIAVKDVVTSANTALPGVFAFTEVDGRGAAISAVKQREAYGAIIIESGAPEVLIATAAGTAPAQLLETLANGRSAKVTDIVPFAASDVRGVGLATAAFPLTLGGMLGGIGISILVTGARRRLVALLVYTATSGVVLTIILQGVFGALQGSFVANAAAIFLSLLAIGAVIVGFSSLVGRAGIAIGPILFLLIANPISSANSPIESLIDPWGRVGQFFPPGATATLLRSLSYFPDAATWPLWLTLSIWAVVGICMDQAAVRRDQSSLSRSNKQTVATSVTSQT